MKRCALLLLASALTTTAAHAQVGVYGNFNATHDKDNNNSTDNWYYGPGAGVYYDFLHAGPISAGFDLRGNFLFGDNYKYRSGLFGVRVAAKPPLLPIKPYVQFSVGGGGAKYTGSTSLPTHYSTKFQYQVLGGVDVTILPHIDLRLAEVGYGRMSGVSGNNVNNLSDSIVSVSSGVVFRFF